ncbi:hypothetical protein RBS60_08135 [Sinomonas sp. ASV486]|uniref:Uncharacterized protein n=1 Tax=Sinomonas puerhi TaxID=3238584 RepID=A0AB39L6Q4_9MICC|nr:hypothetical protein [Sinomonas sp. ASV486]MDQ4490169.1 hypothetical protein [Sinomonas sp. ASV486]
MRDPILDAWADGGWRLERLPIQPLPPELLELFEGLTLALMETYSLDAPTPPAPGTAAVRPRNVPAESCSVLVVLRGGEPPEIAGVKHDGGAPTFRIALTSRDRGAHLVLLTVRCDEHGLGHAALDFTA